jgi:hypothetical protein
MVEVVLCFTGHMFLHRSLREYFRSTFSFPAGIGDNYRLSLGVGKNIFMYYFKYCKCLFMLFLRTQLNFNCVLHFVGEVKILNRKSKSTLTFGT